MPIARELKREALAKTLPRRRELISRTRQYMQQAGLREQDMAARINYSRAALNNFLGDRYEAISGDDSAISLALTEYMDSHPVAPMTEARGKLYITGNVKLIKRCFDRALAQSCAYYFRGAPGCQKTFVLKHLIANLNREELGKDATRRRAYYIRARKNIRPGDLMKRLAMNIGIDATGGIDRILRNLLYELRGSNSLLVLDEAQLLSIDCLEVLRELLDFPGVGLLFAGSHQLEDTFDRLDMAQWRSRIRKGEGLPGLSEDEAREILRSELPKIAASSMNSMIAKSYEVDYYRGQKTRYISARFLFMAIDEVLLRKQEQEERVQ